MSLKGKVAIISGSSAGIGRETALVFAKRGAQVVLHGRRKERLMEISKEIKRTAGYEPIYICGEIEDANTRRQIIEKAIEKHGRIDILVNNAGYVLPGGISSDVSNLRKMFECHCVAPFELCQLSMPYLIESKGCVVMVSSVSAMKGFAMNLHYSTAKAGLDNMMRCLALEVAKEGVRVNSVNPGAVMTEIFRDPKIWEESKKLLARESESFHPNGRLGQPRDIAEAIAFLASNEANMITGTTLAVDGGLTAALKH